MHNRFLFFLWIVTLPTLALHAQDIITGESFEDEINNCNETGSFCVDIPFSEIGNYTFLVEESTYNGGIDGCDITEVSAYSTSEIVGSNNLYLLENWIVNGSSFNGQFNNIAELLSLMNASDPDGNWLYSPQEEAIYGGQDGVTYSTLFVANTISDEDIEIELSTADIALGSRLHLPVGNYNIMVTEAVTQITDDFTASITCQPNDQNHTINLTIGNALTICMDLSELVAPDFAFEIACNNEEPEVASFDLDENIPCITVVGLSEGTTSHCFTATDGFNNILTTNITANVEGTSQTHTSTISANQNAYTYCPDLSELSGELTAQNLCTEDSGEYVSFVYNPQTNCIKYRGLQCDGTGQACFQICDENENCLEFNLDITVDDTMCNPEAEHLNETIYQGQSFEYCFDENDLFGELETIENICVDEGSNSVNFVFNEESFCVTYTGIVIGEDVACIVVTDNFGNTDTTFFNITVITPAIEVVEDVVFLDESMTYCPSTFELPGETYTIENICPENMGENANINVDALSLCIEVEALSIGVDSACIVICDENMICDTTLYYITIADPESPTIDPPIAVNDTITAPINEDIVIRILINDTIPLGSQVIIPPLDPNTGPLNGTVSINENGTLNYTPNPDFCGVDQLQYVLCNQSGCDTALVVIHVECEEEEPDGIVVKDGFSPNDDGVNDTFTIIGIEDYPNNMLQVYNRWGMEIYNVENYSNDWKGDWNGNILPDGVYFYILQVEEEGSFKGSLTIMR